MTLTDAQQDPIFREFFCHGGVFPAFSIERDDTVISREAHDAGDVFRLFTGYPQLLVTKQRIRAEQTGFGGRRDLYLFDTIVSYTAHKHGIKLEWTQKILSLRLAQGKA